MFCLFSVVPVGGGGWAGGGCSVRLGEGGREDVWSLQGCAYSLPPATGWTRGILLSLLFVI